MPTKAKVTYAPFEAADYLDSEEAIAEYLSLAVRDEKPGVLLKALGDVTKARGMAEVAKASGLGRESLYNRPSLSNLSDDSDIFASKPRPDGMARTRWPCAEARKRVAGSAAE
jgi:probable addiction module antidote protein